MASPTANEAAIYEAVRTIVAPMLLDRIVGQPTTSTVNHLRQQIAKIAAAIKTMSWGRRHGHLALVLTNAEYRSITSNPTIIVDRLLTPLIIPEGLTTTTSLTNRATITGLHNLACQEFWKQEAINAIVVRKIVPEAVDPTYVEELEDDYVGYSGQTIKTIIQHLQTEWCIITTLEKKASHRSLSHPMGLHQSHHQVCPPARQAAKALPGHRHPSCGGHQDPTLCGEYVCIQNV
mgnify:CR=1 FL=1